MTFDLVVVSYRSERWLERCLASLYGGGWNGRCWLVDNDALDAPLREALLARHPAVRYLPMDRNLGFGRANNVGIERALSAGADVVGLVNADTWFEAGWAEAMERALAAHPDVGLAAPLQLAYGSDEPAEWTRELLGIRTLDDPRLRTPVLDTPWVEASALFVRRSVLESVGGFDPLFPFYYEDNDLCRRARLAGFRCAVVPSARYHHFGGAATDGRGGVERSVRCDVGQSLYILTDPTRPLLGNAWEVVRMLGRRLRTAGPGRRAFVRRTWRVASTAVRRWPDIVRKRRRDASGLRLPGAGAAGSGAT